MTGKLFGFIILGLVWGNGSAAQDTGSGSLSQFDWLAGRWERTDTRAGQSAFEEWTVVSAGMIGTGLTLQATDTVFVEKLSIRRIDENLYYIAEVEHNPEPTHFKITRITASGFVCENPEHDYPKKIRYRHLKSGLLEVIISGDGRSSTFSFRKKSAGR